MFSFKLLHGIKNCENYYLFLNSYWASERVIIATYSKLCAAKHKEIKLTYY